MTNNTYQVGEKEELRITSFYEGIREGIRMYAYWKDGIQYVGTTGKTLKSALAEITAEEQKELEGRK